MFTREALYRRAKELAAARFNQICMIMTPLPTDICKLVAGYDRDVDTVFAQPLHLTCILGRKRSGKSVLSADLMRRHNGPTEHYNHLMDFNQTELTSLYERQRLLMEQDGDISDDKVVLLTIDNDSDQTQNVLINAISLFGPLRIHVVLTCMRLERLNVHLWSVVDEWYSLGERSNDEWRRLFHLCPVPTTTIENRLIAARVYVGEFGAWHWRDSHEDRYIPVYCRPSADSV